ncbi:MAG: DUF3179 domain-containing protein [Proteobacteria bacterium]|nr:DUF3179 domain-containing protein [Pseudomonadota bacterium]
MTWRRWGFSIWVLAIAAAGVAADAAAVSPGEIRARWPATDWSRVTIDLAEVISGGVPRDGIRSIDAPEFVPVAAQTALAGTEPVIGLVVNGVARAYPLQILIQHEIVNDVIGGVPVAVTFCPLCNTSVVYERTVDGAVLDFGVSGMLRHSDLIMYDRQTESWWQQFTGDAIAGAHAGTILRALPSRLESWDAFRARAPTGEVLTGTRRYGFNPYAGYDSSRRPFLYAGALPDGIAPLARVVTVDHADGSREAWALDLLRAEGVVETGDLVLRWTPGQNSALDAPLIADGIDVGNVVVQRRTADGLEDARYRVDFAFAFKAFHPDGVLHLAAGD